MKVFPEKSLKAKDIILFKFSVSITTSGETGALDEMREWIG